MVVYKFSHQLQRTWNQNFQAILLRDLLVIQDVSLCMVESLNTGWSRLNQIFDVKINSWNNRPNRRFPADKVAKQRDVVVTLGVLSSAGALLCLKKWVQEIFDCIQEDFLETTLAFRPIVVRKVSRYDDRNFRKATGGSIDRKLQKYKLALLATLCLHRQEWSLGHQPER